MDEVYDWHMFDAEHGYEVARDGTVYHVRKASDPDMILATLTEAEYADWREHGKPNPKGLK